MPKDKISCDVEEVYGVLSETPKGRKIYASISWNGREAKDEIRSTYYTSDGEEVISKGISISDEELEELLAAFKKKKKGKKKKEAVNFDEIFTSAPDIISKRDQGFTTKDGFIILTENPDKHKK